MSFLLLHHLSSWQGGPAWENFAKWNATLQVEKCLFGKRNETNLNVKFLEKSSIIFTVVPSWVGQCPFCLPGLRSCSFMLCIFVSVCVFCRSFVCGWLELIFSAACTFSLFFSFNFYPVGWKQIRKKIAQSHMWLSRFAAQINSSKSLIYS